MIDFNFPYSPHNWHKENKAHLTMGERAADRLRNGMGSWAFVFMFAIFMATWALLNTKTGWSHWDEYPFILLNLFLSMLAGLQGAILLIASKRQDSINAVMAEHDYQTNRSAERGVRQLIDLHEQELILLKDIQKLVDQLEKDTKK